MVAVREAGSGTTTWQVRRWDNEAVQWVKRRTGLLVPTQEHFDGLRVAPFLETVSEGNLITNAGYQLIDNLLTNQNASQAMDATHTRIGVGDGTTAVAYTDTDFSAASGSTHRQWEMVTAVFTIGTRQLTGSANFPTTDANFAWNEAGIDVGNTVAGTTVAAVLFNHALLTGQGTKPNSQQWTMNATVSWT